jgi:hypothetical protein
VSILRDLTKSEPNFSPFKQRTTVGYSSSSAGKSVVKPLQHMAHQEKGRGLVRHSWCYSIDTMVDIRSIAASSQPSRREREAEGEATYHTRVRRSRRASGHAVTAAVAATTATQRQWSATTVVTPSPGASPEATLVTACALLNNLPDTEASPEVAEQWHINVDQLIVAAINSPPSPDGGLATQVLATPLGEVRQVCHGMLSSCRSTPPPSLLQEGMRPSWPTTFRWP